jgi:hypothetical protein
MATDSNDIWTRAIERELKKCAAQQFYGRVTVDFARGQIVRVEVTKSVKDPELLSPKSIASGGQSSVG